MRHYCQRQLRPNDPLPFKASRILLIWALLLGLPAQAESLGFDTAEAAPGNLRFGWIHGSVSAKANTDVRIQVHRYNAHTYILRQNPAVHWEAPFMYLLFGEQTAVLLDAGATAEAEYFPLRETVDALIERWLAVNDKASVRLLVMPLGDDFSQTQALAQFSDRPNTKVIPANPRSRSRMLGLKQWPTRRAELDLGGRVLSLIPTPGLNAQALSVYDPWADLLFTGNSFYPGRLVIRDFDAYSQSLSRLLALVTEAPVQWIFGGRIEMSARSGVDYRLRANYRPLEHVLQMDTAQLLECFQAVQLINGREDIRILNDMIVMHGVGRGARDYGYPVFVPEQFRSVRVR